MTDSPAHTQERASTIMNDVAQWFEAHFSTAIDDYVRPLCEGPHVHWAIDPKVSDDDVA